ncbi:hypothetical protein I551_0420 [Mycobacterium ulcerans str. Harvey]|uniref:Uncharacterized protein n=1 Tax=Mycobacterium ulcerans str. Harvey TaxID=1299332 RepID=A0ABN0R7Q3_MYCUL|nr:hypothetical protein I551_0420 [Mycobacterium ulcerans str. Harvey]
MTFLQVSADMAVAVDVPDGMDTATSATSPTAGPRSCRRRAGPRENRAATTAAARRLAAAA